MKSKLLSGSSIKTNNDDVDADVVKPPENTVEVMEKEAESDPSQKSLSFSQGQRVEARYRGRGKRWYKGRIGECFDGEFEIFYDDGDHDRRLSVEFIRAEDLSHENEKHKLPDVIIKPRRERGSRRRSKGTTARAENASSREADIVKEREVVTTKEDDSMSFQREFCQGQRVEARYRGRGKRWYKGRIANCYEGEEYEIYYDDGDIDRRLSVEFIRADESLLDSTEMKMPATLEDVTSNASVKLTAKDAEEDDQKAMPLTNGEARTDETVVVEAALIKGEDLSSAAVVAASDDNVGADGDVSFVAHDADHKTPPKSNADGENDDENKSKDHTSQQDNQGTEETTHSSGKGNRWYKGKVKTIKTIHLYEIEYVDKTIDVNIPFAALRLPQGVHESDIKVGSTVDVLSWQDRFTGVL